MKPLVLLGWVLLGLEACLVLLMLASKNVGDDAAGRGVGTTYGAVLGALLFVAAAAFVWGQRGGPRVAFYAGLGAMALPVIFLLITVVGGRLGELDRAFGRARGAQFADRRVNRLARAIAEDDTAGLRALLAAGGVDFGARNRRGRTLLGAAVERATDWGASEASVTAVALLLDAGAPPVANAVEPAPYQGDPTGHLLTRWVIGRSPAGVRVLELLLAHGAERNPVDAAGQPVLFSTEITLPFLEALARHGADLSVLDTTRPDRPRWSAPMTAALFQNWDQVLFYLDHGADPDFRAPDGQSLRTIVAGKGRDGATGEAFETVRRRLALP